MLACGWLEIHDVLVFNNDEDLLPIISVLLEHRHIAPKEEEWVEETKFEGEDTAEKRREEELKEKATLEREKELAEYQKEKKYREQIAAEVRAKIKADKERRKKEAYKNPVPGNKLVKGAKVRTLQSLQQDNKTSGNRE